jgi:hypothetical protein
MTDETPRWFIRERSEALAALYLTSREDVSIHSEKKQADGVDFYVALDDDGSTPTKLFVVQVRGTLSSNKRDWTKTVKELFRRGPFYLPVCVFVINVQKNDAVFAWVAEPRIEKDSVSLDLFEQPDFMTLDQEATDQIIDRVRAWYAHTAHRSVSSTE